MMEQKENRMIYLDNAATTLRKPEAVARAVTEALCSMGNAGRGGHEATLGVSRVIFDTRRKLAKLFHGESPKQIARAKMDPERLPAGGLYHRPVVVPGKTVARRLPLISFFL